MAGLILFAAFPIGVHTGRAQRGYLLEDWELKRGCNGQAWLLCLGCAVLYSTMTSKVWRILEVVEAAERGMRIPGTGSREQNMRVASYVGLNLLLLITYSARTVQGSIKRRAASAPELLHGSCFSALLTLRARSSLD